MRSDRRRLFRSLGLVAVTATLLGCGGSTEGTLPPDQNSSGALGGMTASGAGGRAAAMGGFAQGGALGGVTASGDGGRVAAMGGFAQGDALGGYGGGVQGGAAGGELHGGSSGMPNGSGGCAPGPTVPEQDPSCPSGIVYHIDALPPCTKEGVTCSVLVPTGLANPCTQPPILMYQTCCHGRWRGSCDATGEGGAGGIDSMNGCYDVGWGLSRDGILLETRGPDDLPIYTAQGPTPPVPSGSACEALDQWRCHLGAPVVGGTDERATPTGTGGTITPGAYALVELDAFGGADPELLVGTRFRQTLYFSDSSALFQSDDDHRFGFTGAYSYSTRDATLMLEPSCESQPAMYRQWSLVQTFTASSTRLELYSPTLNYGAVYERLP